MLFARSKGGLFLVDILLRHRSNEEMRTYVTKPYLPPLKEFLPYLENIWESRVLSNGGPFHTQFEQELCAFLKVKQVSLFSNGTMALQVALKALDIENAEVITTPYSFVATSSTVSWGGNTPVFVDIDPQTTNICPEKIEAAITEKTKAILAVHCYGIPCNNNKISAIAKKYDLKLIYDAAHAFGVEDPNGSILNYGDLSILSFHATKAFNTFEGGAIVCHTNEMKSKIDRLKNFGFTSETVIEEVGINAKMAEFNAALGVLQLKHYKTSIEMREKVDQQYRRELDDIVGIDCLVNSSAVVKNYNYFPILVNDNYVISRDELCQQLKNHNIYARRYFYPLISDFAAYKQLPSANTNQLPIAKDIAARVICLPIYPEIPSELISTICNIIKNQKGLHCYKPSLKNLESF